MSAAYEPGEAALRVRCGIELQFARHEGRGFEPHFHEEYQFMVITDGGLSLLVNGVEHEARRGEVCAIAPGQVHGGRAIGWGWVCQIVYAPAALIDGIAAECGLTVPHFASPVVADATIAQSLADACDSDEPEIEDLRQALALLLLEHAAPRPTKNVLPATGAAEAYIREHVAHRVTLERLAALCGLSRYHFLRVFAREWGLTPMAYQAQLRTTHALRLLRGGLAPALAAQEAGFFDQSHLNRALRRSHALTSSLIQRH